MEQNSEKAAAPELQGAERRGGFGALLRAGREKAGLSLDDVSSRTKISYNQLEALEAEDLRHLPEPVYIRAFIRDICRVTGEDSTPILSAYARVAAPEDSSAVPDFTGDPAVPKRAMTKDVQFHARPRKKGFRVFLAFAAVVVLIVVVWAGWRQGVFSKLGGDSTEAGVVSMQEASGRTAALQRPRSPSNAMPANAPLDAKPGVAASSSAQASSPAAAAPDAARQPEAAAGDATVTVRGSWVKLVSSKGKVLFQGALKAGEEKSCTGKLPIRATVGNSTQCAVELNGTPVDLSGYTKGSVARVVLK